MVVGWQAGPQARLRRFDEEEDLIIFDRLAVFNKHLHNFSCDVRFDLIHQLHRFDDTENGFILHQLSNLNIGIGVRRRRAIKRPDDRGFNFMIFNLLDRRERRRRRSGGGDSRSLVGRCRGYILGAGEGVGGTARDRMRMPRNTNAQAFFLNFNFINFTLLNYSD
jgi:hypothetical protein